MSTSFRVREPSLKEEPNNEVINYNGSEEHIINPAKAIQRQKSEIAAINLKDDIAHHD